jgi:hypothetical protein
MEQVSCLLGWSVDQSQRSRRTARISKTLMCISLYDVKVIQDWMAKPSGLTI